MTPNPCRDDANLTTMEPVPPTLIGTMFDLLTTLVAYAAAATAPLTSTPNSALAIEIHGKLRAGDVLMVAVYADADRWLDQPVQSLRSELAAEPARTRQHTLATELPAGRYAVAVYVDRNRNGKLDLGMFSIPSEPYGFSGGGGRFGRRVSNKRLSSSANPQPAPRSNCVEVER